MRTGSGFTHVLASGAIAVSLLALESVIYHRFQGASESALKAVDRAQQGASAAAGPCGAAPVAGTTSILRQMPAPEEGGVGTYAVKNELDTLVVALLGNAELTEIYRTIVVAPGAQTTVRAPAGHYGLGLLAGKHWCGLARGFLDGSRFAITGGVTIHTAAAGMNVLSPAAAPNDFRVRYVSHSPAAPPTYVVPRTRFGFMAEGTVRGVPVAWLVDTGATSVMIPAALAVEAGVRCTAPALFSTASGESMGCSGVLSELSVGPFTLTNVEVGVLAGVPRPLLGMSALRRLTLVVRADALTISRQSTSKRASRAGEVPGANLALLVPWPQPETRVAPVSQPDTLVHKGHSPRLDTPLFVVHATTLVALFVAYQRWLRRYRST